MDVTVLGTVTSSRPGEYRYDARRRMLSGPWHAWQFDMATGQSWFDPGKTRMRPYDVVLESGRPITGGGEGRVPGPYVVETLPVAVDGDDVVVTP